MNAPENLETARLILRRPQATDTKMMFERYSSDPEVTRYLGWPTHRTIEDTQNFLLFSDHCWSTSPAGPYLIELQHSHELIGSTGLMFDYPSCASTGYVLAKSAWGKGYATEALNSIIRLAPKLGIERCYALCHPSHAASIHVLLKCGFQLEEILKHHTLFPNLLDSRQSDVNCYVRLFPRSM